VLHKSRLERLATDKHSGLLNSPISYEENEVPGTVFTKLHFLRNLWMSSISQGVCRLQAFQAYFYVTLKLIGLILKLQWNWSVVNTAPHLFVMRSPWPHKDRKKFSVNSISVQEDHRRNKWQKRQQLKSTFLSKFRVLRFLCVLRFFILFAETLFSNLAVCGFCSD